MRPSLVDLYHSLDALRERLSRVERASVHAAPGGAAAPSDPDPQALGIVQDILSIPSSGLHPAELFTLAMDRTSRLLAADRAMLFVAEPDGSRLVPRSAHGFRREDLASISVRTGEGIVGQVFKERRVVTYSAGGDGGEVSDEFIERFPVQDAIAVPVRAEDEVAGVLYAGRRRLGPPFSANDVLLLLVIADRVGGGLVHQALLDRGSRHIARLAELRRFAQESPATQPLSEVLARVGEAGCRLVDVRAAVVALAAGADELELVATRGLPGAADAWRRVSTREGLTAEVCAGEGPLACRDVLSRPTPERSFLGDGGFHGCLLLPLRVGSGTAGVLYLADTEVRDFSVEEIEAARVLAAMVASAIETARSSAALQGALEGGRRTQARLVEVEKARVLGEMAGGLARELNNVFATILGKSRLLLARAHDEPLREGLGLLEEAAWRGADVVHRLIALAAPTSGEAVGPVEVTPLLQDVVALTKPGGKDEAEGRKARIDVVTDLRGTAPVRGNAAALREALANLVLNAVDAMPEGGRLSLVTRSRDGGVELLLEDSGEGIPDDVQGRIFDPFFTTRSPQRLGLGLTVARGVLTRHGGWIELSSVAGRGTQVRVWLPGIVPAEPAASERPGMTADHPPVDTQVVDGRDETTAVAGATQTPRTEADRLVDATTAVPGPPPPGERGKRPASILVLEDEAPVRSLLVEALTQAGHTVDTASDGPSGLAKLEGGCFDLVLTDLALPQRSGLAIARSVKRLHPGTPVVLITGWGHLLDPERLREHGVDLMLVKPFRLERVLAVVGDALRLRSSA